MPSEAADSYRTAWLQREQHGGSRDHVLQLLDAIRHRHAISGRRVLELGSGLGANLRLFAADNLVQGVDSLCGAVERAGAAGIPTLQADLERDALPWTDGSWDWVLLLDVLEHLVAPHHLLAQAHRLLAPQGRLVVNVPNCFDWRCRWRLLRGGGIDSARHFPEQPVWRYPHLRFFRHGDLLDLLRSTGFALVEDLSGLQASLPKARRWPALARRIAARWPDAAASGFFVVAARAG